MSRFWLIFHFPSSLEIGNRKPTIPRNITSMYELGASDVAHGLLSALSCWVVSSVTCRSSQSFSFMISGRPYACTTIIPCRHNFPVLSFGRIPIGRDVTLRSLKDHEGLIAVGKILPVWNGTREMAFDHPTRTIGLEHGRYMTGKKARRSGSYQRSK